jgi:hypothetical protein
MTGASGENAHSGNVGLARESEGGPLMLMHLMDWQNDFKGSRLPVGNIEHDFRFDRVYHAFVNLRLDGSLYPIMRERFVEFVECLYEGSVEDALLA